MEMKKPGLGVINGNGDEQRTLVTIFLRGGADGLTLAPPVGDPGYYKARPTLSVSESDILKLGDANCGLHPSMTGLHDLFKDGQLSVIPAVGSSDNTRSHFYAQDLMEHGGMVAGGWLGRFLRYRDGAPPSALSAIALGKAMPEVLRGAPAATVMESMDTFSLGKGGDSTANIETELAALYGSDQTILGSAARDTLQAIDRVAKIDKNGAPENGASYDDSTFANGLRQTAQLIRARVGLEAVSLDLDGWDSHFAQETLISSKIPQLSDGLTAFHRDLGKLMEKVTVVVMTEFGRRVAENSSFGTDHGRGGVMFVMGGGTGLGRVEGTMPELDSGILVGPGDVPVQTDYREVLKPILTQHGARSGMEEIFPGMA